MIYIILSIAFIHTSNGGLFMPGIFFILFFAISAYLIINFILNSLAPEESINATLVKKECTTHMDANNHIHTYYILHFNINGTNSKFNVSYGKYKKYTEGQYGHLIYKRKRFVDFIL